MEFSFSTTPKEFPKNRSGNSSTHSTYGRQSAFGAGRTKSFGAIVDANSGGEDQFPASSPTHGLISKVCRYRKPARHGQSVHEDGEYVTSSIHSHAFKWEKRREPRAIDSIPVEPKLTKPGRICCSECSDGILLIQEEASSEKMAVVESILKDWQRLVFTNKF